MHIKHELLTNGNLKLAIVGSKDELMNVDADFQNPLYHDDARMDVTDALESYHAGLFHVLSEKEKILIGDATDGDVITSLDKFGSGWERYSKCDLLDAMDGKIELPENVKQSFAAFRDQDWSNESWVDGDYAVHDWIDRLLRDKEVELVSRSSM
jgi:hypothetical protein